MQGMHISRTDLNLFVVFEAIYSQGGVTRAAEILNLTQPTISHALGRLRDRVNDPLFVRHGQKLVPTTMADKLIIPVREALQLFERTLGDLEGFNPAAATTKFSVGLRSLMENAYFVPLSIMLRDRAPFITLNSSSYERQNLETELSSGKLNAAIDVFLPLSDAIKRKHLSRSPGIVIARRDHPVVQGKVDMETYLKLDHVMVSSRPSGPGPEDIALSREGKSRRVAVRCQQLNTAMRIVSGSDLLLTMASSFAERANVWFDNQILQSPFPSPEIDAYLYWHSNSEADRANIWFREMIENAVAENITRPL